MDRGRFGLFRRNKLVESRVDRRRAGGEELFQIKTAPDCIARVLFHHKYAVGVVGKSLFGRKPNAKFRYCFKPISGYFTALVSKPAGIKTLNAELTKKALEKVGNPNVLVNLVSRRVRQLNSGAGAVSRPLIDASPTMGVADIALTEIIEEKIGFEMPELVELTRPTAKKRGKKK
jgi:DNA-directed RNA polymerase subunit omega